MNAMTSLLQAANRMWVSVGLVAGCYLASAADVMPPPTRAFSPKASVTLYLDSAGASRSALLKAIEERTAGLSAQFATLPGMPAQMGAGASELFASLKGKEPSEIVVVMEGDASGLGSGQLDPAASFLVAVRMDGAVDLEALLAETLALVEKEKPGSSNAVMASRSRVGAADVFAVPAEALGGPQMPFGVSVAAGPGEGGTVFALGRTEKVREYVEGKGSGTPPPALNTLLPARGQFWLVVTDVAAATRGLAGAAAQDPAAPAAMVNQTLGRMKDMSEMGLGVTFGDSAMDVVVAFGLNTAEAAQQMATEAQGVLGMIQMMSAQNPGSAPPMLGKLKAESQGKRFAVSTSLTMADVELGLKNVESAMPGLGAARRPAAAARPLPKVEALPEPTAAPLEATFLELLPGDNQDLRRGRIRLENRSAKAVREARMRFEYLSDRGVRLGDWQRVQRDVAGPILVGAQTSRELECHLFKVPFRTETVRLEVDEVTFADGTTWKPAGSQ